MNHEEDDEQKSKSELKRDSLALQKLGETLVELPIGDLEKIPMPESLATAVMEARGMHQRSAKRRHLQFIGKLMRNIDVEPIATALAQRERGQRASARAHHELEQLRDDLLANNTDALEAFISAHPAADRQLLRQLIRNAAKEKTLNKPPASARKLFQLLRDLQAGAGR